MNPYIGFDTLKEIFNGAETRTELQSVVKDATNYDIYDLIKRLAALNLFHQNQTKGVVFDSFIDAILHEKQESFSSHYCISPGKFRRLLTKLEQTDLMASVDPPENTFVQNVICYGNYRVFNGIDQTPAYNLQQMINALLSVRTTFPEEFIKKISLLTSLILQISESIVQSIDEIENNHREDEDIKLYIPANDILKTYSTYVEYSGEFIRNHLQNEAQLLKMITIDFASKWKDDFDNRCFYSCPFLYNPRNDTYIVLNVGLLPTALFLWVNILSQEYGIQEEVMNSINSKVFNECKQYLRRLGHYKIVESDFGIELIDKSFYKEFIATVHNNQFLLVTFVCDDGYGFNADQMHSHYQNERILSVTKDRISYFVNCLVERNIPKEDIFAITIVSTYGRGIAYTLGDESLLYDILKVNPFELCCISINEDKEDAFIPRYIRAKSTLKSFKSNVLSELNQIEIYKSNDNSFYMSDNFAPEDIINYFAPGDSIDYTIRALKKEGKKIVNSPDGNGYIEVILNDEKRSIYGSYSMFTHEKCLSYYIELSSFNIWILSHSLDDEEAYDVYHSILDLLSYWIAECKSIFENIRIDAEQIIIKVELDDDIEKYYYVYEETESFENSLEISINSDEIVLILLPQAFTYLNHIDNCREKEFISLIIDSIFHSLDIHVDVQTELDRVFANPMRKKMFSLDYQRYPYLKPVSNRDNRYVHGEDEDILLDDIGRKLLESGKWKVGKIEDSQRGSIANEVVGILYQQLQEEVVKLKPDNLVEAIYDDLEKVLFKIMLSQRRYASDIACYPEKEKQILDDINRDNKASMALKFLMEYVAATPPNGTILVGSGKYEYILAICSLIIDWAYKNDLFHYDIFNTPIEILKSQRIGMKQNEFAQMTLLNEEYRRENLHYLSSKDFRPIYNVSYKSYFDRINKAFETEHGYSFIQMQLVVSGLRDYSSNLRGDTVYVADKEKVIGYLEKYDPRLNRESVYLIIQDLSLERRDDFLVPPNPYRSEDVYPWRFNREYSFVRRPIILRGNDIIWGNRYMSHMLAYTMDLINEGKYKANKQELKSLIGEINDVRGDEFNELVYEMIKSFGEFDVYLNVKKVNRQLISDNHGNTLGDIDVLIIDKMMHVIVVAEVKDFNFSRNPYEMNLEYRKMFEDKGKKKSYYTKQSRRVSWCRDHIDDFKIQYNLDDTNEWRIVGTFLVSQPLISNRIFHKDIAVITKSELSVDRIRAIY